MQADGKAQPARCRRPAGSVGDGATWHLGQMHLLPLLSDARNVIYRTFLAEGGQTENMLPTPVIKNRAFKLVFQSLLKASGWLWASSPASGKS